MTTDLVVIQQLRNTLNLPERDRGAAEAVAPDSGTPSVKGVDKTYQWGGAKVYHQRGHWPA